MDSHYLVRVDNVCYSVPVAWAYHPSVIEVFVDKIRIFCDRQIVAVHRRCYIDGQFILEPTHYLKPLQRKPGSLDNARAFKDQPWGEDFDLMRKELEYRYSEDGTMRAEFKALARKCSQANAAYEDFLQQLAELEVQHRTAVAIERRLRQAAFPMVIQPPTTTGTTSIKTGPIIG